MANKLTKEQIDANRLAAQEKAAALATKQSASGQTYGVQNGEVSVVQPATTPSPVLSKYKTLEQTIAERKKNAIDTSTGRPVGIDPATEQPYATTPSPAPAPEQTETTANTPTPSPEVKQPTSTPTQITPTQNQDTGTPTQNNGTGTPNNQNFQDPSNKLVQKTPKQIQDEKMAIASNKTLQNNLARYTTGESVYNAVQSGQLIEGTQDFNNLTTTNPTLAAQYNQYKQDKKNAQQVETVGNVINGSYEPVDAQTTAQTMLQKIVQNFVSGMDEDIATSYSNMVTNNQSYIDAVAKNNEVVAKINEKNSEIRAIGDDVRKTLSGDTPESLVASRIARETRPLLLELQTLQDEQSAAQSEMNRILDENKTMFALQQQDRQEKQQMAMTLYGTLRAEEIRQEDIEREDIRLQKEIAREEMIYGREKSDKLEELKQQEEANLSIGLLNKGIDPTGMTPEEMRKSYANATQKEIQAQTALDYAKITKVADNGDGTPAPQFAPVFNDDGTMKISNSSVYNLAIGPDGNSVQVQGVKEGGYAPNGRVECGAFVNDLIGVKIFGNNLSDKTKNINSKEPVVGGAFIEDVGPYGHVGFIESINDDNSINIIDSNYSKDTDGKIRRDTIAVGSPRWNQIRGFYDPSLGGPKPLDSNQRIIANAEKSAFRSNAVVKAFEEGLQQYKDIVVSLNDESGPGDTAGIFQFMKSLDPTSVVRESEFNAAAKSAGVFEYIGNTYDRVMKGKKLSSEQAIAFKRLAKAYVNNRAESYNRLYDDMARSLENQGIHQSYYPSRATDDLLLGGQFQTTKTDIQEEDAELDSLRTETTKPIDLSKLNIGTNNAININRNTPGLTPL